MSKERIIDNTLKNGVKRIGIITAGGDCPGLNAVIRSIVMTAHSHNIEVVGIHYGYRGMLLGGDYFKVITPEEVNGILGLGGTILHSTNKDNLFRYPRRTKDGFERDAQGGLVYEDLSEIAVDNLRKAAIDAMIIVGGDGTLTSGRDYSRMGVPVVGVPKTIDNDLKSTDITFGFDTAVSRCVEAVENVRTTGEAHSRVMMVEVMGRNAGHIALHTAISSAADIALIPEIPYDFKKLVAKVRERLTQNGTCVVIVSEGVAPPVKGSYSNKIVEGSPDAIRFGGVGSVIGDFIEKELNSERDENGFAVNEIIMDVECRATNVGYAQRGGAPTAADRMLCTRLGVFAIEQLMSGLDLDEKGNFGKMVSIRNNQPTAVLLEDVINSASMIGNQRLVDVDGELVHIARSIGISFAD